MKTVVTIIIVLTVQFFIGLAAWEGYKEGWRQSETTCHPSAPAVPPKPPGAMGFRPVPVSEGRIVDTL